MSRQYNAKEVEEATLDFWKNKQIYEKSVKKNSSGKIFYYLDGPPYTTGKIHIGHAWGKALRDQILRFKRMKGFNVWDKPGFDMHGLPIEVSVEKELGIKDKREIEKFGTKKFIEVCEKYAIDHLWPMVEDFKRLGVWLNWKDPYMTVKNEYIEGAWWALAKAHEKNLLYLGKKSMTWCPRCATALAKHELEYEERTDDSIYVKFPIKGEENTFIVIWTTTPWTIAFNLAVMAHPDVDYAKVQVDNETWIVAEELRESVLKAADRDGTVLETVKGKDLEGMKYSHPFEDVFNFPESDSPHMHAVVLSTQYVTTEQGSGLVHCAPGCGPEDFDVGKQHGLPPFNEVDDHGCYSDKMGELKGFVAKVDDQKFIDLLEEKGFLITTTKERHEYAHCWRCKSPVIFRATDQWFLATEKLKDDMIEKNKGVHWVPDWAGNRWFDSWLNSLQDWCISRQRFWGIPLPIWPCDCGEVKVIGTIEELKKESGKEIENLHRPWIDEVKLKCKCGKETSRVSDILDVWLDSGVSPWATLGYPSKEEKFKELGFPDLILEGKDQIRGWFNSLMCMSMISFGEVPYKAVYMHGFINDTSGRKMSKSLKNIISPYEIIDVYGADTMRYYQIGGAQPGVDLNFNHDDAKIKSRNLGVWWNVHNFVMDLAKELKCNPEEFDDAVMHSLLDIEERYMLSTLSTKTQEITKAYDEYKLNIVPHLTEDIFLTLSRTYIKMVREKASVGEENDRKGVLYTAYKTLKDSVKLMAPLTPFISEQMWQNFRSTFNLAEESVHLCDWPAAVEKDQNKELEQNMNVTKDVVQAILAAREKAKISVRWPVKTIQVISDNDDVLKAIEELEDIIKNQTNCKEVHGHKEFAEVKMTLKPDQGAIGKEFGANAPKIMASLEKVDPVHIAHLLKSNKPVLVDYDDKKAELTEAHILIERNYPDHFIEIPFRNGFVYLDKRRTSELDAEGFAREVMRRVQALRKEAGFSKEDEASVYIQTDEELKDMLSSWSDKIKEKCGASILKIDTANPAKEHEHSTEESVKDKSFTVFMDRT